jgi:hypothetical protein
VRRLAAIVAAALALSGCVGGEGEGDGSAPAVPSRTPPSFVGIVSEDLLAGDASYRERMLVRQASAGIGLVRQTFHWDRIERSPGHYDFAEYDAYVEALARHDMELLPILFSPPGFRASGDRARGTPPPDRPADLGAFAARLVERYGPHGSFWRERPRLRRTPIRAWQVWNEPNLPQYWPEGPDPGAYAELLRATADAIRRADPHAKVVSAGLSESRLGMPFRQFVTGMYEAGAGHAIDVFALHAFARSARGSLAAAESTRALLEDLGQRPEIWVTEFGWASGGPASPFTTDERGQAAQVGAALRELIERREELGLRGAIYYAWRDAPVYEGGQDFFGLHTGLLDIDGRPKPALEAFRSAVAEATRPRKSL